MTLVLGAAFGPEATEVEVRDATSGALVAAGSARHADLDPDVDDPTTWWRSLASAVGQTGEREIAAISVCGSHPGLVLLDGAGAVLRPMQPWDDVQATAAAGRLRTILGVEGWAEQVGMLPTSTTAVSRLAWLRRADPDTFGRIGAALLPHDWLTYRLTGRAVTDRGGASLTGAWSPGAGAWVGEVLEELAPGGTRQWWAQRLPAVLGPAERADWLDAPVYELLGLRGRPLVGPGTGEPMAVALALGVLPGRVGVALGPVTTVLAGLARPLVDPAGAVRSHGDATGRHLAVAAAGEGAGLLDGVGTLLGVDAAGLARLVLDTEPDPEGLVVVPQVPGRRGAVLTGLTTGIDRGRLARAVLEGVACSALDALDDVIAKGAVWHHDEPVRLAAPAGHVDVVARLLAELSGRAVSGVASSSLAAAGSCVQAAAVLTGEAPEDVAAAWQLGGDHLVEPVDDPSRTARRDAHRAERERQRQAWRPTR